MMDIVYSIYRLEKSIFVLESANSYKRARSQMPLAVLEFCLRQAQGSQDQSDKKSISSIFYHIDLENLELASNRTPK
jgi:hypothetical protein